MIIRNDMNISYVRVLNASPDAPAVDIYINGGLIFKNIKFKDFTEYVQLSMGQYKMEVYPVGQMDKPVLAQNIQVPQKQVITIAATGNFEDLQLIPYIEGNADGLAMNQSRVRLIHLSPDAPEVDVLINGQIVFNNIGFMDATDYIKVVSGTYNIVVNLAGTNDTILTFSLQLNSQKVYTVYVVGNPPNLSEIQSLDGSTFVRF